jgi:hypothetical protein
MKRENIPRVAWFTGYVAWVKGCASEALKLSRKLFIGGGTL